MESQNSSSIHREFLETKFVYYEVNDKTNQRHDDSPIQTLGEAIDAYKPDADLFLVIGTLIVQMDVGRDMYGFHRDLLKLSEQLAFNEPSSNAYIREAGITHDRDDIYTVVLTDFYHPLIIYFILEGEYIMVQTRTLQGEEVIMTEEDITTSVQFKREDLINNICEFLHCYLENLLEVNPIVSSFTDYQEYIERLTAVEVRH